jgi:hypothetical protein
MAKFKFEVTRRSIMLETYFVEADTEEQALEICYDGDVPEPALEFVDWMDDEYEVEGKECIDPLYVMVKDYDLVDKLEV